VPSSPHARDASASITFSAIIDETRSLDSVVTPAMCGVRIRLGQPASGLPAGSFGFIYLPALAGTVVASMLVAPFGAKLTHTLPVATVKRIFAGVLVLLSAKMLWGLFG